MQMPTRGTHLHTDLMGCWRLILKGTVVAIDPSVGSTSSLPAYAIYRSGELVCSDVLEIDINDTLYGRLRQLARLLRNIYSEYEPDILVYEEIPPQRYGGGNAEAHASLLKAVGVILSVPGPVAVVRMRPMVWKKMVRDSYRKGDIEDAEEMGYIAVTLSQQIESTGETSGRKKRAKANVASA